MWLSYTQFQPTFEQVAIALSRISRGFWRTLVGPDGPGTTRGALATEIRTLARQTSQKVETHTSLRLGANREPRGVSHVHLARPLS